MEPGDESAGRQGITTTHEWLSKRAWFFEKIEVCCLLIPVYHISRYAALLFQFGNSMTDGCTLNILANTFVRSTPRFCLLFSIAEIVV